MRMIAVTQLLFCTLAVVFPGLTATSAAADLRDGGEGKVVKVVDGDTLVLADGRSVRLVGIQTPKLPLGRRHIKKQPFADQSKRALEALTLGKTLRLYYGGRQ